MRELRIKHELDCTFNKVHRKDLKLVRADVSLHLVYYQDSLYTIQAQEAYPVLKLKRDYHTIDDVLKSVLKHASSTTGKKDKGSKPSNKKRSKKVESSVYAGKVVFLSLGCRFSDSVQMMIIQCQIQVRSY